MTAASGTPPGTTEPSISSSDGKICTIFDLYYIFTFYYISAVVRAVRHVYYRKYLCEVHICNTSKYKVQRSVQSTYLLRINISLRVYAAYL